MATQNLNRIFRWIYALTYQLPQVRASHLARPSTN